MLRTIFWVFVLLLALSFFGISLQAIINSPAGQENFSYLFSFFAPVWQFIVHIYLSATEEWIRPF